MQRLRDGHLAELRELWSPPYEIGVRGDGVWWACHEMDGTPLEAANPAALRALIRHDVAIREQDTGSALSLAAARLAALASLRNEWGGQYTIGEAGGVWSAARDGGEPVTANTADKLRVAIEADTRRRQRALRRKGGLG